MSWTSQRRLTWKTKEGREGSGPTAQWVVRHLAAYTGYFSFYSYSDKSPRLDDPRFNPFARARLARRGLSSHVPRPLALCGSLLVLGSIPRGLRPPSCVADHGQEPGTMGTQELSGVGRGHNTRILMLTNVESGQANIFLATSQALLQANPGVELHVGSFAGLRGAVAHVSGLVRQTQPRARPIAFHAVEGLTMAEGKARCCADHGVPVGPARLPTSFQTPLRFSVTLRALRDTVFALLPHDGPQLVQ